MVQDVIKGDAIIEPSHLEDRLATVENSLKNLDQVVKNLQIIAKMDTDEGAEAVVAETGEEREHPESEQPVQRISLSQLLGGIDIKGMQKDVTTLQTEVTELKAKLKGLNEKITTLETGNKLGVIESNILLLSIIY